MFLWNYICGVFYIPLDDSMPVERVKLILNTVEPEIIIYDKTTEKKIESLGYRDSSLSYDEVINEEIDEAVIIEKVNNIKTTDLLYVIYVWIHRDAKWGNNKS